MRNCFPKHYFVSGADRGDPADGQAAGGSAGAVGICGHHAGGQPGIHTHAGRLHPAAVGADPHFDGAGAGTGAVGSGNVEPAVSQAFMRKTGDFN